MILFIQNKSNRIAATLCVLSLVTPTWTLAFFSTSVSPKLRAKASMTEASSTSGSIWDISDKTRGDDDIGHNIFDQGFFDNSNMMTNFEINHLIRPSYLDLTSHETTSEQSTRFLNIHNRFLEDDIESPMPLEGSFFQPLDCNVPDCKVNTTWMKGGFDLAAAQNNGTIVVPCGTCVWMDYQFHASNNEDELEQDGVLVLPHGLDIQGHLYFPDGYNITIRAPFILVQGRLEMHSTGKVGSDPLIKFIIGTGIEQSRQSIGFLPAHNNERVCPDEITGEPGTCDIGFRSVTVAGGTIEARGLPKTCTTWTQLYDVVLLPVPKESEQLNDRSYTKLPTLEVEHTNPYCRSHEPYVQDDFESGSAGSWTGGYGATVTVDSGVLAITKRKSIAEHGPTLDMVSFQECLVPGQEYLFSAKIRLHDPLEEDTTSTPCEVSGCLDLVFATRLPYDGKRIPTRKQENHANGLYRNNEWENFYATVTFNEEELDSKNAYQILILRGAPERYDIYMDNVTFSLPSASLVPDPEDLCGGNMVMNGDAEASEIHPYPMKALGGQLTISSWPNTGNRTFHLTQRSSDFDSLAYNLDAPNCFAKGARYQISARVYAVSEDVQVQIVIKYRIRLMDGALFSYTAAKCPPSQLSWQQCESKFSIMDTIDPSNIEEVRFWFETIGAPTVDYMVDDFVITMAKAANAGLLVPGQGIVDCWDEGAEIIITSHTTNTGDSQVRRLVNAPVPVPGTNGMVRLDLDENIIIPVTAQHDEGLFPVEVALLSRNIRFEAPKDKKDPLIGGHFMVLRTPTVVQHVEGVEFVNFGQQGYLGRYPIHIHLCKDAHSVIAKNTVRGSNQRCVVIHGSYNTTILENVAYDTFGHCFLTEDGGEIDNKFIRNLGSNTKIASRIVRERETDDSDPSTFWSANPQNEWIGNVAAGSEANGYWLELLDFVKLPSGLMDSSVGMIPKRLPLTTFANNIAHSNYRHGLKMYPHGLLPSETAIFDNFKSYKNRLDGIFFRNVVNSVVQGGIFADNRNQVDLDRGDTILMNATRIIGSTDRYREIVIAQGVASYHQDRIVGLELHQFVRDPSHKGLTVQNISFEGFHPTAISDHCALVEIDRDSNDPWTGNFNYWTTFEGVRIKNNEFAFQFDFNQALNNSFKGVYLVDLDSSMKPPSSTATGTSTVIADSDEMKAFVDLDLCTSVQDRGYLYCQDTCLRSVTFAVDPGQIQNLALRIRTTSSLNIHTYEGGQDVLVNEDPERHVRAMTNAGYLRYFTAALPKGQYTAMFVNNSTGLKHWPTFVETIFEPSLCDNSFSESDVKLEIPELEEGECTELIRNGDMEQSEHEPLYWLQQESMLAVANGRGRMGSNAITEIDQDSAYATLGQYVDVRCLTKGQTYSIQAWVYVEEGGVAISCDDTSSNCPRLGLQMTTQEDNTGASYKQSVLIVATSFVRPFVDKGWNLMQGIVTVDDSLATATRAFMFVERRRKGQSIYLDNVSMTRIEKDCSELVFNGDMSEGTTAFWDHSDGFLDLVSDTESPALMHSSRRNSFGAITQRMLTGCMKEGERYLARAKVKVLNPDGSRFECNPSRYYGDNSCPNLKLRAFFDYGQQGETSSSHPGGFVAHTDYGLTSSEWMTISDVFSATKQDEIADQSVLYIDGPGPDLVVVVDEVSISPLNMNCNQLILNGDAERSETAQFWRLTTKSDLTQIKTIVDSSGNHAFHLTEREYSIDGIQQGIDNRCLHAGSMWKVEAQMKLLSRSTGNYVACVPGETNIFKFACPSVRLLAAENAMEEHTEERFYMTNVNSTWVANEFNKFESIVVISSEIARGNDIIFALRGFDSDWDLIVDNISFSPFLE
ncbi:hypothetical protein ACA910_005765 [Epithemia clementina (nom. ined.)]